MDKFSEELVRLAKKYDRTLRVEVRLGTWGEWGSPAYIKAVIFDPAFTADLPEVVHEKWQELLSDVARGFETVVEEG